jgi:hypothetical protein
VGVPLRIQARSVEGRAKDTEAVAGGAQPWEGGQLEVGERADGWACPSVGKREEGAGPLFGLNWTIRRN